jgi:hypothetical protein
MQYKVHLLAHLAGDNIEITSPELERQQECDSEQQDIEPSPHFSLKCIILGFIQGVLYYIH